MTEGQRIEFLFHYFDGYRRQASKMTGTVEVILDEGYLLVRADTGAGYDVRQDNDGTWHHS
jgi:hypothetical protein